MYGAMKYVGEVMTKTFTRTTGIPHVIVRPSAVYGPTDLNGRIVQKLVEAACWARPITLVNPETTLLDFTYVADVAQGLSRALAAPVENETFNITNGHARSLADLHDLLRAHFPDLEAEVVERTEDFRPRRGTLDVSKARELLGYEPEWSLEAGIETYLEFMRSLPAPAREPVAETSS
jgi:UDP-glucose 4-epimerase